MHVCKMIISPGVFFSFLKKFWFLGLLGGKRTKNSPKWEITIASVTHHFSRTVHHLIVIVSRSMENDDICRHSFQFFKILIFQNVAGLKEQKIAHDKNNYIHHTPYLRNRTSYDHNFWYTYVKWWYLQAYFSFFQNF